MVVLLVVLLAPSPLILQLSVCSELPEADPCRLTHSGSPALWLPAVHAWEAVEGDQLGVGERWFGWFLCLQPQLLGTFSLGSCGKATSLYHSGLEARWAALCGHSLGVSPVPQRKGKCLSLQTLHSLNTDSETQKVIFLRVTPDRQGPEHSEM